MTLLLLPATPGLAASATCYGPARADVALIYLHGLDNPRIGAHERENRKMLRRLAEQRGWRIAVPRGNGFCRGGRRQCWKIGDAATVRGTWQYIRAATSSCFRPEHKPGLFGFSNGGFYAAALYSLCLAETGPAWILAGGSAGARGFQPRTGSRCPTMGLMMGKKDITLPRARRWVDGLQRRGIRVPLRLFSGGHVIDQATLIRMVQEAGPQ